MLEREHWQYAYADQVFLVRRYEQRVIRDMIIEHLQSTTEKPRPPQDTEDRYVR